MNSLALANAHKVLHVMKVFSDDDFRYLAEHKGEDLVKTRSLDLFDPGPQKQFLTNMQLRLKFALDSGGLTQEQIVSDIDNVRRMMYSAGALYVVGETSGRMLICYPDKAALVDLLFSLEAMDKMMEKLHGRQFENYRMIPRTQSGPFSVEMNWMFHIGLDPFPMCANDDGKPCGQFFNQFDKTCTIPYDPNDMTVLKIVTPDKRDPEAICRLTDVSAIIAKVVIEE